MSEILSGRDVNARCRRTIVEAGNRKVEQREVALRERATDRSSRDQ